MSDASKINRNVDADAEVDTSTWHPQEPHIVAQPVQLRAQMAAQIEAGVLSNYEYFVSMLLSLHGETGEPINNLIAQFTVKLTDALIEELQKGV